MNLGTNALKFTPHGEVRLFARFNGREVSIGVRDTGIGIAAEDLPCCSKSSPRWAHPELVRPRGSGPWPEHRAATGAATQRPCRSRERVRGGSLFRCTCPCPRSASAQAITRPLTDGSLADGSSRAEHRPLAADAALRHLRAWASVGARDRPPSASRSGHVHAARCVLRARSSRRRSPGHASTFLGTGRGGPVVLSVRDLSRRAQHAAPLSHAPARPARSTGRSAPRSACDRQRVSTGRNEASCFNTACTQLVPVSDALGVVSISGLDGWSRWSADLLSIAVATAGLMPCVVLYRSIVWRWLGRLHPTDISLEIEQSWAIAWPSR